MTRSLRSIIFAGTILAALATGAFAWHLAAAKFVWPWADGRLSYIFLSSILGANAGIGAWVWLKQDLSALKGALLDAAVVALGLAGTFLVVGVRDGNGKALTLGVVDVIVFAIVAYLLLKLQPLKFADARPTPRFLRWSFALFAAALFAAAAALLLRAPHIFPWPLQPRSSVAFGCIFLGSAVFYGYATLRPMLSNAYPQAIALLCYDLILIVPFLRHLGTVAPAHRPSLVLYVTVLVYSGLLMLYYLAIDPGTRVWGRFPQVQPAG